jgi:hypothetical protein
MEEKLSQEEFKVDKTVDKQTQSMKEQTYQEVHKVSVNTH